MIEIELTRPEKLAAADWQTWRQFQQADSSLDSPYFHPEFTQAVAAVRGDVEIAVLREKGEVAGFFPFQRGTLNLGKPVGGKLSDYHGVITSHDVQFDVERLVRACGLSGWDFDHLVASQSQFDRFVRNRAESPYLDLTNGYEAYATERRQAGSDTLSKLGRKIRKFERECGELQFTWHDTGTEVLETLRRWKSAQYLATGLADVFAFPWTTRLLEQIAANTSNDFGAVIGTLRAGGTLTAICYSLWSGPVLHAWFNVYDPTFAIHSPGLALFDYMARESEQRGITKIDLGKGDERYKRSLASRGAPLAEGSVELRSLSVWIRSGWRQARKLVRSSPLASAAEAPGRLIQPIRQWLALH